MTLEELQHLLPELNIEEFEEHDNVKEFSAFYEPKNLDFYISVRDDQIETFEISAGDWDYPCRCDFVSCILLTGTEDIQYITDVIEFGLDPLAKTTEILGNYTKALQKFMAKFQPSMEELGWKLLCESTLGTISKKRMQPEMIWGFGNSAHQFIFSYNIWSKKLTSPHLMIDNILDLSVSEFKEALSKFMKDNHIE